ncbi:apolipoprotein N-acyltransferase [bacterium BMS3Bbin06]|nr:apolipoprotein N-acyltransferase [bacterium BMS3Abin08]GBE33624.1 apolipoprotein N-acyltransferase [bacterium BMS3Bbin06]HDY72529.1 apolipoprotein N-acyltransferase [Nitrospirota bacterium]
MNRQRLHPGLVPYLVSLFCGLFLAIAYPPQDLSFIAWAALAPFLVILYNRDGKIALRSGIIFGLAFFLGTQYWIYFSMNRYGGLSFPASISIVFLLCLYESLYMGVFALLISGITKRISIPLSLIAPPLWCTLEYLRGHLFTGFPWSLVGYTQYSNLSFIQIADITGVYGVSFLVILVNSALSDIFIYLQKRRAGAPAHIWKPLFSLAVAFSITLVSVGYGRYTIKKLDGLKDGRKIRVAVVQGNIEQDRKWDSQYQNSVLETYMELSRSLPGKKPDLIVWPETALPFYFNANPELHKRLTSFVKDLSIPLLTGTMLVRKNPATKPNNPYSISNSALLLDGNGNTSYQYDKIHLVPFGEYVPLKKVLFFINKIVVGIGDFLPGKIYANARTEWGSFSTLICYEIIFPDLVRRFFKKRGDLIVNITNDAWFGKTSGPYQHFSMAVFRAIENRKPLVRAANTGISGFIDQTGRIRDRTGLFERAVIVDDIEIHKTGSIYRRFGDIFSFLNIGITLFIYGLSISIKRRI